MSTRPFRCREASHAQASARRALQVATDSSFVSSLMPGAADREEAQSERSEPDISAQGQRQVQVAGKTESPKSFQLQSNRDRDLDGDKHSEAECGSSSDFRDSRSMADAHPHRHYVFAYRLCSCSLFCGVSLLCYARRS